MALYRHVAMGTFPGEEWTFTLHTTGSGSLAAAQTSWEAATGALWTGSLDGIVATDIAMTEVTTASLDEAGGGQLSRLSDAVTRPGVSTEESLPAQCAVAVSTRSSLATRGGRGRFYLPPVDTTVMDAGRLSAVAQALIVASAELMFSTLDGSGLSPVLLNRTTMVQTPITAFDVGDVIDTQRRRRNKLIEARVSGAV